MFLLKSRTRASGANAAAGASEWQTMRLCKEGVRITAERWPLAT